MSESNAAGCGTYDRFPGGAIRVCNGAHVEGWHHDVSLRLAWKKDEKGRLVQRELGPP
jgi:hypothetical protein